MRPVLAIATFAIWYLLFILSAYRENHVLSAVSVVGVVLTFSAIKEE